MNKENFKKFGYDFIDWLADYMAEVEKYPVLSQVEPGDIKARIPSEAPYEGEPMDEIFADFKDIILPGITHWQHPNWYAYFPAKNI
ncbi:MAG: pyridoxal-dependent decarboxylase, partial [Desulfobacterales bacterium]